MAMVLNDSGSSLSGSIRAAANKGTFSWLHTRKGLLWGGGGVVEILLRL